MNRNTRRNRVTYPRAAGRGPTHDAIPANRGMAHSSSRRQPRRFNSIPSPRVDEQNRVYRIIKSGDDRRKVFLGRV